MFMLLYDHHKISDVILILNIRLYKFYFLLVRNKANENMHLQNFDAAYASNRIYTVLILVILTKLRIVKIVLWGISQTVKMKDSQTHQQRNPSTSWCVCSIKQLFLDVDFSLFFSQQSRTRVTGNFTCLNQPVCILPSLFLNKKGVACVANQI